MRFAFGDCTLDTERYELRRAGQVVALEPQVFRVLAYLLRQAGRAVSKQELVHACWPSPVEASYTEYALRNCLHKIRHAVGDVGTPQVVIETVRGYGYRWVTAVTTLPPDPADDRPVPVSRASPHPLPGRRQLTVLRCALVEEPTFARLDPEDVQTVLQAFYSACETVIQRSQGYAAQYDSTGLLVYFGYPAADEAAARRAVRAGLMLVDAVGHLTIRVAAGKPVRLAVRLGIHTGLVVVGTAGAGGRHDPVALGDTPQVAARLQERAALNTVVVSAATWRLVQGYFTGRALEPQPLAGEVPEQAYRVLGTSGAQSRLEVEAPRGLTPLVGREPELALLHARWAQARDGLGQVVVLSGEPGIGKSRLVQALHAHLAAEPHVRIEWRCAPDAQQSPLHPVVAHMHRLLRWHPEAPPEAMLRTLEATLAADGFALPEVVPLVAALLSLPLPTSYPPLALTPQRQRHKTLEVLLAWLLAETTRHPLLFIVEDLHWSDPSTLEFLTLLIDRGPTARLLTLLTCRPEFAVPWGFRAHCMPLTLNRLPQPQATEMIARVAGSTTLPPAVMAQIAAQTDGVPLFIEELTKMVLESGLLREGEDRDAPPGPLPPLAIPATLHDSLMARLDRLGPVKAVAQLGATIGRTFAYALLQAMAALDDATLQQGLRQLVETELVYQQGVPPQATYTFKHALIQEAAYQSLLRSTRQRYHLRLAQVVEAQFPETCETQPELLAHHYTEAGWMVQAIPYWQRAGERAVARSAYHEAISHFTRGLAALHQLPETPERAQRELALHLALGMPLQATKGFTAPEVGRTYARARELCRQVGDTPHVFPALRGLVRFYSVSGAVWTAHELAETLLRLAQQAQDTGLLLEAHRMLGMSLYKLGEFVPALTHFEHGLALYTPQQHHALAALYVEDPGVVCRARAAVVRWALGAPDQALEQSYTTRTLARELSHAFSLGYALSWIIMVPLARHEGSTVSAWAEELIGLSTEHGFTQLLVYGTILRGWVLATRGQAEEGIVQMRQGLTAWRELGVKTAVPYLLALLAEAYGAWGHAEDGLRQVTEARAVIHDTGERFYEAEVHRLTGELLLQQAVPDMAQAEACFQEALTVARRQQARSWELRAALSLSRLWQQQGKCAAARTLLAPIYGGFTEGFDTADLQEAKVLLGALGA